MINITEAALNVIQESLAQYKNEENEQLVRLSMKPN